MDREQKPYAEAGEHLEPALTTSRRVRGQAHEYARQLMIEVASQGQGKNGDAEQRLLKAEKNAHFYSLSLALVVCFNCLD